MEPTDFTTEQRAFMPDHIAQVLAKDQPQYRPLPIVRFMGRDSRMVTRWTLTADERALIAAGEDLYIEVLTFGMPLQPLLPTVGLREFCPADGVVAP